MVLRITQTKKGQFWPEEPCLKKKKKENGIGLELSTGMSIEGNGLLSFQVTSEDPHFSPVSIEIGRPCLMVFDGRLECGPHDCILDSIVGQTSRRTEAMDLEQE